ncbi:MAG: hypothetical protein DHS20C20_15470 [Ardenticatenaceae bacterium]|nr:MAG: hypothetical protein DHS20C20_15470 [Ardenticatenaceae bacterium]
MQETSEEKRKVMSWIAIGVGLLMVTIIPFLVQVSLERVLAGLIAHVEAGNPTFSSGVPLFDFFYPVWRAVIFVAGIALIIISQEIKKGEPWAYQTAASLFALPSIGGMFMFLPYVSWVEGFPLPLIISLIGLAGFWSFILLPKGAKVQKWTRFGALTFIGMLTTHAFTIGIGAQRTMATRPGYPMYKDFTWWLFNWVGEVNWVAAVLLFASIPLLIVGRRKGWWLAVIATVAIMAIDIPTQFFRTKTLDYLYGALLGLGVLLFTVVPYFRQHLLNDGVETDAGRETAVSDKVAINQV